jgi:uncharacterized protein (TIGR02996 family)
MSDEAGFLQTIITDPDDDAPRLVYADWLEEHGQTERAEFIRVQCELAKLPEDDVRRPGLEDRERSLLRSHEKEWNPFGRQIRGPEFRRGFAESLNVFAGIFLRRVKHIFGAAPVRELRLGDLGGDRPARLAACPFLERVRSLHLHCRVSPHPHSGFSDDLRVRDAGLQAIIASPHLTRLTTLELPGAGVTAEGARALVTAPSLAELRSLDLMSNDLRAEGARALAAGPYPARLTVLSLGYNDLGDEGAATLARAPRLAHLEELDLGGNGITAAGAQALAGSPHLASLRVLRLACVYPIVRNWTMAEGGNPLGAEGIRALVTSPHLVRLRHLDLH